MVYSFANAFTAAVPILLLPLLTRILSPADYGLVAMFGLLVQLLGAITGLSVHGAVGMRYFERESLDFPRYVASALCVLAVSSVVVLVAVLALMPLLEELFGLPRFWLIIGVFASAANFVTQIQLSIWQSARRPVRFASLRIGQAVLDLAATLILVLGLAMAWEGRTGAIAAAAVLTGLAAAVALRSSGWARLPIDRAYMANAVRFGAPLVPHALGGLLVASIDRLMITNVLDVANAGIYFVAVQIGLVINLATDAFNRAFAPWLIESLKTASAQRDRLIVRATYGCFALLLAGGLVVGLLAPYALDVAVGPQFRAAGELVIYIAIGQAFGGMYYLVTNYVFFAGRTGRLALVSVSAGLLNVALSYFLLTRYGLVGAGIAFVAAQMLLFAGTFALAATSHPMPWLSAFRSPSPTSPQP
ncbi:MAG: oligosaccharide flippase family protein [Rhizobiaceae bacterium]|nr:oligosaccharide flippase family protein [Rhizobiaceae bacterium]